MGQAESNESAAVKRQAEGFSNPMYRMLDLGGGGLFMELGKRAMLTNNTMELDEAIRSKIKPYIYNGGDGKWIHCAHLACLRNRDRPKSKQFPEILALGDAAFDFQFEGSDLLAEMIGEDTRETHPDRFIIIITIIIIIMPDSPSIAGMSRIEEQSERQPSMCVS